MFVAKGLPADSSASRLHSRPNASTMPLPGPTAHALSFHDIRTRPIDRLRRRQRQSHIFDTDRFLSALPPSTRARRPLPEFARIPAWADVRHIGSVAAIELKVPDAGYLSSLRPRLYEFYLKSWSLLRPLGTLCTSCALRHTPGQLKFVYDIIRDSLACLP